MKYDFSGMATVNDLRCSDGRTIRHGAFADCDGKRSLSSGRIKEIPPK